jgi:hypothetical protein
VLVVDEMGAVRDRLNVMWEIKRIKPCVMEVLLECVGNAWFDGVTRQPGPTFQELVERVPASDAEINKALDVLKCIALDGRVQRIQTSHLCDVATYVVSCVQAAGWLEEGCTLEGFEALLREEEDQDVRVVAATCFRWLTVDGKIATDRVTSLFARKLLEGYPDGCEQLLFMHEWRGIIPIGFEVSIDHVQGISVLVNDRLYPVFSEMLPQQPIDRFNELFHLKPEWTKAELVPFIQDVCDDAIHMDKLLLKHCRVVHGKLIRRA